MAGKSTLNRLEQALRLEGISFKDRYLCIAIKSQAIEQVLIDLFFDLFTSFLSEAPSTPRAPVQSKKSLMFLSTLSLLTIAISDIPFLGVVSR